MYKLKLIKLATTAVFVFSSSMAMAMAMAMANDAPTKQVFLSTMETTHQQLFVIDEDDFYFIECDDVGCNPIPYPEGS